MEACEALPAGSLNGKLALIDRGSCDFVVKVRHTFAHYGVGVGAEGTARGSRTVITESFIVPPECSATP